MQDDRSGFEEEIVATIGAPDRLAVLLSEAYRQVFEQDYLTGDSQDRHELDLRAGIQGLVERERLHAIEAVTEAQVGLGGGTGQGEGFLLNVGR